MADNSTFSPTGREISLSFKKSTEGLTPAEEQELQALQRQRQAQQAGLGGQ